MSPTFGAAGDEKRAASERTEALASEFTRQVGEVLEAARGDRSIREVSRDLGWSHVSLLRLERGEDNPTLGRLAQVAEALGGRLEVTFVPNDESDG